MFESYKDDEDDEDEDDLSSTKKENKQKRLKRKSDNTGRNTDKNEDDDDGSDDRGENRKASFFRKRVIKQGGQSHDDRKKQLDDTNESDDTEVADQNEEEDEHEEHEGLSEAEAREAVLAIIDGLTRELRSEFEDCEESSFLELQTIVVSAFVDNLREKLEAGDRDFTKALLDEALQETLIDLLGGGDDEIEPAAAPDYIDVTEVINNGNNASSTANGAGGKGNNGGSNGVALQPSTPVPPAVAAFVAANQTALDTADATQGGNKRRGKGLLVGGIVGYIMGRRHGRRRAEEDLQPKIDTLEGQVNQLYEAIAARELMIRQVVAELKSRQLGEPEATRLTAESYNILYKADAQDQSASRAINPPSLVLPVAFAALLVSHRLKADTSQERHTWGKDFLIGGLAGYMIGRRHGRKLAETHIKSDIEQLERQVGTLQKDFVNRDTMVQAMMRVIAKDDEANAAEFNSATSLLGVPNPRLNLQDGVKETDNPSPLPKEQQPKNEVQLFVDASIERIAVAKKKREIKRHKEELMKSGKAEIVGGFNLAGNVFLERRLIDGSENSNSRKPIESMDESELLSMSQNIYVDGESAIDLYVDGQVELEVLREAVTQFWRKTGDYEQTLRENLKRNNLVVDDIRANLEKAYRTILNDAQSQL